MLADGDPPVTVVAEHVIQLATPITVAAETVPPLTHDKQVPLLLK